MNSLWSKLPWRHTQRQALHSARNAALQYDLQSREHPQAQELWTRKHNEPDSNWDTVEQDSGYSSHSNLEAEARYYDQMMDKFEEEGPTLSNPDEGTLDIMRVEKQNWQKWVSILSKEQDKGLPAVSLT